MVKKVLALALGLVLAVSAMAQMGPSNPTVSQNDIQFWTGTGSNRAVVAITWNDAVAGNIGIAWGVQWNGSSVLIRDIMDTIAAYDSRLNITWNASHTYVNNLGFTDTELGLNLAGELDATSGVAWWWYNWKDANNTDKSSSGVMGDVIANGDFVDWIPMDPDTYDSHAADTMIMAVDPNASADPDPVEATIAASDILYWVGDGSKQVVLAVNWADTALAWGYKFNGTKTVADMMADIATADPRFSYTLNGGYLGDILFALADGDTLRGTSYWESKNNGVTDAGMAQELNDGDFEKWADPAAGVIVDSSSYEWDSVTYWYYIYVYPMAITPVDSPVPVESTIAASDILYWVGTGAKEVVLAVNWADIALAWGYRFDGTKSVSDMMNDIAAADPRFSIELGQYGLDDILFVRGEGDTLRKQMYSYWESKNNGVTDAGMAQELNDGDFEKWAEPAAGVIVDSSSYELDSVTYWYYIYVYNMPIQPVSAPTTQSIVSAESVSLSIYPNPAVSNVTISFGALENATEVVLYDMTGRRVAASTVAAGSTEARIAVDGLANGVYMLRMGDATAKVVVR